MINLLKFLLNSQLKWKRSHQLTGKTSGFTLIELLVGLVLAFLVIIPLLGFMVNMVDTDRRAQAKTNSEQEIQTALNYIARDLDQSIYIYDATGLAKIKAQLPGVQPGPGNAKGEPILVFWKRKFLKDAIPIRGKDANVCPDSEDECDDAYIYSLVAYYLIKDEICQNSTWSCTTRIGRVELEDELKNLNNPAEPAVKEATEGFQLFNLNVSGTLEDKMNQWETAGAYDPNLKIDTLIDYIDQTTYTDNPNLTAAACSTDPRNPLVSSDPYPHRKVPIYSTEPVPPDAPGNVVVDEEFETGSFYACVDSDKTTAQVFIRGNALARTKQKDNPPIYNQNQAAYFPTANIQAKGRGLLSTDQE